MHTSAFVNQKGGCGKTTTAVNLAGALAARGERVLLVDLDPQAHATLALGCAVEDEPSLLEVLADGCPTSRALQEASGGISLLPATLALGEFEERAARMHQPEQALRLALEELAGCFDHALLDCPPRTDGVLAANALRAADTGILVIESGAFALQGALRAVDVIEAIAADRVEAGDAAPFELRAVATLFDRRTRLARELMVALHARFGELLFDTAIRTSVRLREAAAMGVPVEVLHPSSRAAGDFRHLAEELVRHVAERDARAGAEQADVEDVLTPPPPRPRTGLEERADRERRRAEGPRLASTRGEPWTR